MLGIIIITYNCQALLRKQIARIGQHCRDKFEIIVIDNSTDKESIKHIKYICSLHHITLLKTDASSRNGSGSHAFAANVAWQKYGKSYSHFLFLDHDCFPIRNFSVEETLGDKYIMAGIGQDKSRKYLWPGCLMLRAGLEVDFSPSHELGLDTGGNLYKIIEQAPDDIIYFDEVHKENPEFTKNMYNFYSLIYDGTFMHFINSSNWSKIGHHEERLNSLLNVLDKY